jgi:hypothetical protein
MSDSSFDEFKGFGVTSFGAEVGSPTIFGLGLVLEVHKTSFDRSSMVRVSCSDIMVHVRVSPEVVGAVVFLVLHNVSIV